MDEQPKRRWFQIRLSTVLILTAIAAWGMACRPWFQVIFFADTLTNQVVKSYSLGMPEKPSTLWYIQVGGQWGQDQFGIFPAVNNLYVSIGPADLCSPFLALVGFVAVKRVWRVIQRRRTRLPPLP